MVSQIHRLHHHRPKRNRHQHMPGHVDGRWRRLSDGEVWNWTWSGCDDDAPHHLRRLRPPSHLRRKATELNE